MVHWIISRPDGKTQVTVEYENDRPTRVDTIVISTQHSDTVALETIREDLKKHVIDEIVDAALMDDETKSISIQQDALSLAGRRETAA